LESQSVSESQTVLDTQNLGKTYITFGSKWQHLRQLLWPNSTALPGFSALRNVTFSLQKGAVLGVIGQNGAGKSTLLQILAGTLPQYDGILSIRGRVAALLELGAGFNPELTGRENVYLFGAMMGVSKSEMQQRFDEIVDFSGVSRVIDQPVKTYSSGMFVRLAFSVATSVNPDILIVDEALSVGDGAFARKSFDRIMELRDSGTSIIFCSHALYQVQVLSDEVLWLEAGEVRALGVPREVIENYQKFLDRLQTNQQVPKIEEKRPSDQTLGVARLTNVSISADGDSGEVLSVTCEKSELSIEVEFSSDLNQPCPTVAIVFTDDEGKNISSCTTFYDHIHVERNANGDGKVVVAFPKFGLMHGRYWVNVLLMCEKAIMTLDGVYRFVKLDVEQVGHEVGVAMLPRLWNKDNSFDVASKQ